MKYGYMILASALALIDTICMADIPEQTDEGFKVPQPGTVLNFPESHGAHPPFKIEWWYLTGHLYTQSGRRFGYQATFFRSGLQPAESMKDSPFGNQQAYLTHMAVTDVEGSRFFFQERLSRDGWDAFAKTGNLSVRNGNWTLKSEQDDPLRMRLQASIRSDVAFNIRLEPDKPMVRFGEDGTSRKGPSPSARSYYLSFTRLLTSGTLQLGEQTYAVTGLSWMDHEIASSQLDPSYTGWDWIAIQLRDGWEVKAYLLRQEDGSPSPYSALVWISPEGTLTYRGPDAFTWDKSNQWTRASSANSYPNRPTIQTRHPVTGETVTFQFQPVLDDQELVLPGSTYWEGAGDVLDASNNTIGTAYLELVGYGGPIRGLQ